MKVKEFLDNSGVRYKISLHASVFTAQRMAAVEHEHGRYVAKPVIIKADGRYLMCVLPASHHVDLAKLKSQLAATTVELAQESEIAELFPDCDVGADGIEQREFRISHGILLYLSRSHTPYCTFARQKREGRQDHRSPFVAGTFGSLELMMYFVARKIYNAVQITLLAWGCREATVWPESP